jgi:hypothetical protein
MLQSEREAGEMLRLWMQHGVHSIQWKAGRLAHTWARPLSSMSLANLFVGRRSSGENADDDNRRGQPPRK